MTFMEDDDTLRNRALKQGWITSEEAASGEPLAELISEDKIRALMEAGFEKTKPVDRRMMNQMVSSGFLQGDDILDPVRERFGRYEIVRRIGEGGTGQVYLAHDPEVDREVAIKILDRDGLSKTDRFRQEMEILAAMRHPGIVTIFDAGVEEGQPYYTMEYIGAKSLQDMKPSIRESVDIVELVAEACHAAHEKGVIHRDLKPANILMGDRPIVADFGIAKRQNAELTETGMVLGTPYYMSPEQAVGNPVTVTTDLYSLGVILYELVTGFRPFEGLNVAEITRKIIEKEPVSPRKRNGALPRDLELIVLKAIAKEPELRYQSAREFAGDLRAWKEGRPVLARRTSLPERILLAAKRKPRVAFGYAGALSLALVALVFGLSLGTGSDEDPRQKHLREEAEQTIANERVAIEAWRPNLYLPPRKISYAPLEVSIGKIEGALKKKGLSTEIRSLGFLATARAHSFMGDMQAALLDLEASIRMKDSGDARIERVFILWESTCRERFLMGNLPHERFGPIQADLEAAIRAGFSEPWRSDFAGILLRVAERPDKEHAREAIHSLENLKKNSPNLSEEVEKFIGDMYFFLGEPEKAVPYYQNAVADRRSYVQAWNSLGTAFLMCKKDPEGVRKGVRATLKAIEINPRYLDSYRLFSRLCEDGLRWYYVRKLLRDEVGEDLQLIEEARTRFQEAPDTDPIFIARGTAALLIAFFRLGMGENPEPVITEAVGSFQEVEGFEGWFGLGRSFLFQAYAGKETLGENLTRASEFLERCRAARPEDPELLSWIGFCRFQEEDFTGAVRNWKAVIALDSAYKRRLERFLRLAEEKK